MHLLCSGSSPKSWESQGKCLTGFPRVTEALHHLGEERVSLSPLEHGPNTKDTAIECVPWGTPSAEDKPPNHDSKVSRNATEWHGAQTTSRSWSQVFLFSYAFGGTAYPTNVPYKNLFSRTDLPTLAYSQPLHSQYHHIIYEEFRSHW